jgi:membrane peptidoglycan carboxypeptidase
VFKPFVLASALKQGISPATHFESEPQNIPLGDRTWTVANYENAYYGNIDLATATVESDNSIYAQLTLLVGPGNVARTARALGVRSELDPYYAIGLGVEAVNPLESARAYGSFASGGSRIDGSLLGNRPRVITQVADPDGRVRLNRPIPRRVLTEAQASMLTSILQRVIDEGTGRRAKLDDRPAAGKTGTTENYGDAWFVGYTPQLVVAVWVGYPETLEPMLTEYHGRPVSGGTFPAEIWKQFMQSALEHEGEEPEYFPAPPYVGTEARLVTRRGGRIQLDNGVCRARREVVYFAGMAPTSTASCKPNEVAVPRVVGQDVDEAQERLAGQPLAAELVYAPAPPRTRPWRVVKQYPSGGYLSSYSKVKLVVTKPVHGVVPNLVGRTLADAEARLRKRRLKPAVSFGEGKPGTVVRQVPAPGLAAAPGLEVTLVVARD